MVDAWLFRPPVLVGERIVWLGSGSGLPQGGIVRWIGRLPEMGPDWTVGMELDNPLPYGGIDGTWGNRHLFTCEPKHGLLVPMSKTIKESELLKLSRKNLETNLQYGRGGNELFTKVHSGPPSSSSRPQVFPTPVATANKLVTSEGTPEEPRPAIRRKRQHQVLLAAQQPKPPKRKVKCAVTNPLPKIYESNKENSRSLSSLNDFNTLKSTSTAFHTLTSSVNDLSSLKTALDGFSTLRSSLNDFGTLKTCTSGDYSDYQWFDAKDDKSGLIDHRNILYEPVNKSALKQCHVIEGQQIRIIQENSCKRIEVKTSSHNDVQIERMSEFNVKARCDVRDDDSSYEDAATTVDGIYPDQNSTAKPNSNTNTNSNSRQEKTASGFFSFLRWFRKGKDDDNEEFEGSRNGEFAGALTALSVPSSPVFIRSTSSSCGSIDTLFSTATVNSFAFVTPTYYRPFGSALQPEKRIAVGPDTDTYRHRLHQRDHIRELDKNLTLKKKYHLFGSETTLKSGILTPEPSPIVERKVIEKNNENQVAAIQTSSPGSDNSTFGRKKRKAPVPPDQPKQKFSDNSLPNSLEKCRSGNNNMDNGDPAPVRQTRHRRTVSESAKDKKAGAYCHVKGKRKAPQPPNKLEQDPSTLEKVRNQFSSLGRKKRPAPQPPETSNKKKSELTESYQERSKSTVSQLSQEEKDRLIANIAKLKAHADRKSMNLQRHSQDMDINLRSAQEHIVCNDSLKLERGVLKPNKEIAKADTNVPETKATPVSPRPWYKRSLTNKEGLSGLKRDIFKSLEKKKDREKEKEEEWMPEVGIPRVVTTNLPSDGNSCSSTSSRFNIFSRLDRSDDKKAEKRKSQVSMLANISELDREAAEIVQKEQAREQALMAAQDAKFYSYPEVPIRLDSNFREESNENVEVPKRSSAKELISLFNAISNVTKVTVNSTFFSKEGSGFFSKEGAEKRFSFMGESVRTEQRVIISDNKYEEQETMQSEQSFVINSKDISAGSACGFKAMRTQDLKYPQASGSQEGPSSSGITIEEVDDDLEKASRSRVMYEANKSRRHHSPSPSIPTIAEQSESASSVATTPASTLNPHLGSNRDSILSDMAAPSTEIAVSSHAPDALQQAKKMTIWTCSRCTLENPRWKITCDACGKWRPSVTEEKSDMAKCDEPFQRPTSPLHDTKKPVTNKVQVIKMDLTKKGKGINWEEEIKRYLPQNDPKSIKKDKSPEQQQQSGEKSEIKSAEILNAAALAKPSNNYPQKEIVQSNDDSDKIKTELKNQPGTFIGGKLKQDRERETYKTREHTSSSDDRSSVVVNGTGLVTEEPDVDEVRKARLAFFKRNTENNTDIVNDSNLTSPRKDNSATAVDTGTRKQVDENEQLKLREMLKEMKNSLPKRPKQTVITSDSKVVHILKENEVKQTTDNSIGIIINDNSRKLGAIKKIPQKTSKTETKSMNSVSSPSTDRKHMIEDGGSKFQNGDASDENKAEAVFITKKTVYEDIKVKKITGPKPMKVSTSVQTSSVMRKVDSAATDQEESAKTSEGKPPSGKHIDVLPVTVEELSNTGIKDGVLYTSLNKESRRIGTGTFELIRAKDFASIEATKTSVGTETSVVHVYANVPSSLSVVSKQSSNSPNSSGPRNVAQSMLPSQQPTSPSGSSQPSDVPADTVKVPEEAETAQVAQNIEKKSTSSFDGSSRGITSTDSRAAQRSSRATSETSSYSVPSVSSGDYSEVEKLTAQLTLPKGIADFKADLQATPPEQNMNTLAINRLLRRLEAAIAGGQHNQAAVLAKDLARLKISCSVTRQRRCLDASPASIMVEMYVEDKVSHQGPIPLQVVPSMTVAQMKQKVQQEFEIPTRVQRWILGKMLASDDAKTLQEHNVSSNGCPMFLYLVAPDGEQEGEPGGGAVSGTETQNVAETTTQAVLPPPPPQPDRPGGWYYNDEEDRYSFCEDTESELTDDEDEEEEVKNQSPAKNDNRPAVVVAVEEKQDTTVRARVEEEEEEEEEDEEEDDEEDGGDGIVGATAVVIQEKPVVLQAPIVGRPFVRQSPQLPKSSVGLQTVETSPSNVRRSITPQSPKPARDKEIIKPGTSQLDHLAKLGPSGQVIKETEEGKKSVDKNTGTLTLGWKCPLCTLVNSPTRPGCAACTTERPINYIVPVEYHANKQELQRMKNEQQVDNDLQQANAAEKQQKKQDQHQHYLQLVNLDKTDLVPNVEPFECSVCFVHYNGREGVVLRECLHTFCRGCLAFAVQFNEEAEVKCPYRDADYACNSVLQEREIKALVPADVYEQHLAKSVAQAENKIGNAFHCKTPDCRGWCIFEDNVNEFKCPVCSKTNCLTCQAIHDGMNCKQYQEQVKQASETDAEARRTKEMLEEMVVRGEAMNCPTCQVILMKKWGCDWLRCSMCKTEICWVTRGPRWGPGGKGDTTGGCQCGVNGVKCHPRCNYCH